MTVISQTVTAIRGLKFFIAREDLYLLHELILFAEGCMLEVLGVGLGTQELLVGVALMLARGLAQLTVCVDLVSEIHLEELLLLLLLVELLLDLIESLFRTEMRLVVKCLDGAIDLLRTNLLSHLASEEVSISLSLFLA